jgi:hypothetical protein
VAQLAPLGGRSPPSRGRDVPSLDKGDFSNWLMLSRGLDALGDMATNHARLAVAQRRGCPRTPPCRRASVRIDDEPRCPPGTPPAGCYRADAASETGKVGAAGVPCAGRDETDGQAARKREAAPVVPIPRGHFAIHRGSLNSGF